MDPEIYDEGDGPVTMSTEIMDALRSGGFPFWATMLRRRRFTSPIGVAPSFEELLPVLRHNLLEFDQALAALLKSKPARAQRRSHGMLCPQCTAVLKTPADNVQLISCPHCGERIELA